MWLCVAGEGRGAAVAQAFLLPVASLARSRLWGAAGAPTVSLIVGAGFSAHRGIVWRRTFGNSQAPVVWSL